MGNVLFLNWQSKCIRKVVEKESSQALETFGLRDAVSNGVYIWVYVCDVQIIIQQLKINTNRNVYR